MIRRRINNQNIGIATVGGDTYIVQLCSSSPVGGDANIMTVTWTATTTRHQIKSIFDDKHIGRPMFYVLTLSPTSSPSQVVGPVGPLAKLSASERRVDANRRHWLYSVSALSVDPSAKGRLVRKRADSSAKLLARLSDNLTGG